MIKLFQEFSEKSSQLITHKYSTSFGTAVKLLSPKIRNHIYNIYGFVRIADEIVDSFHGFPKEKILKQLDQDYKMAIEDGISVNPILNSFQKTITHYKIPLHLVESFMDSMRLDLEKQNYNTETELQQYVYGSAEVVGLMCLKVFVNGSEELYEKLQFAARQLGSAFQKVNFLRDLRADFTDLERSYFPGIDVKNLTEANKNEIVDIIEKEFADALEGIRQLPVESKLGVYVAYNYFLQLTKKIKGIAADQLLKKRIRISNAQKLAIVVQSRIQVNSI